MNIDRYDQQILEILQADGRINNQDLADRIGLSPSPCLRRVRALEESGLISGYYAQLGSSGYPAQSGSSGYSAKIGSSGDSAKISATGKDAVVASAGPDTVVTAAEGAWISVAEFVDGKCVGFATGCIGKDGLLPNTPYRAKGGKLVAA